MTFNRMTLAVLAATASFVAATPAFAGTCPAGKTAANALDGAPTV